MKYRLLKFVSFVLLFFVDSCIEPFSPPEVNSLENHLVVDGFLNVGRDTSRIELRRTQNVNQTAGPITETGAEMSVEAESGEINVFTESKPGHYILPPRQYDKAGKYRLRIKTRDAKEYLSDYVEVSVTPTIDSLTTKFDSFQDAMVFYVNTHDTQGKTQFYRWKFEETWEYRAAYQTAIEVIDKKYVGRQVDINRCWGNQKSGSILLGTTVKLSSDIIKDLPLFKVPVPTNKLFMKYSVLVKQYGLSRPAFEYWTSLSKTTQGTGTLFDPQPSQVTGNIRGTTNGQDLVFGYFSASTEETKRLTVTPRLGRYPTCMMPDTFDVVCNPLSNRQCGLETTSLLMSYAGLRGEFLLGAPPECTDCRTQGGTLEKPSYW
ncbi:DUF4249 domain-containing protein [Dyadobacter chenwenxiniae]|uniref:DUF4249 domain-containing protein n=1 Tax=Dyadobacter chenwenxiniae TaxID=2906456 RepID=A0A9X1PI59_9BACT|nr:DUF4249 domain-containing protein [Dyadobacter chenwenxiniae]MCF0061727.1 DUF4249 domain-containing protein [Dyadobacter chenwenxiniae]UON81545.1 DUF4249 domain-containing protein [Dyadobacter chenwenxiniae]